MLIRNVALAACLLCIGSSFGQEHHYTVKEGDTLSKIAGNLNVSEKALVHANDLRNGNHLSIGQKLVVPSSGKASRPHLVSNAKGSYKVKPGDNDETIAHKFHVSARQIRQLNPDIRWSALRIGASVHVPGGRVAMAEKAKSHKRQPEQKVAKTSSKRAYVVKAGDTDERIAKHLGVSSKALRKANPGIHWSALQIGKKLRVPGDAAVAKAEASHSRAIGSRYAKINSDDVNVRRAPRKGAGLVTTVDEGTRVTVLDRDGEWYKVRFPRGTKGWVKGDFLDATHLIAASIHKANHRSRAARGGTYVAAKLDSGPVSGGEDLVKRAREMLGVRYVYGASSRHATDCSGLTSLSYRSAGLKIPRTSREQSSIGRAVHKSDLKAGDLVFFKTGRSSRINHVGIYEGNGKFIHASSADGRVRESSLFEGYYTRRYAAARRVLKGGSSKKHATPKHVDPKHSLGPDEE